MKKKIVCAVMAVAMMGTMAACGGSSSASSSASSSSSAASSASAASSSNAVNETASSASSSYSATAADFKAADIDDDGKLTVGFDAEFPPMGFMGDDGQYTGFDLELAAEAAKRLGLEVAYSPIDWDSKDMELESGNIDCIWNGFTMQGRENDYAWSDPYMSNDQVFVVTGDSTIQSADDLAGKTVDVQTDSSAQAALEENKELTATFGQDPVVVKDYNTGLMDLESGACDAVAMDSTVAGYYIAQGTKDIRMLDDVIAQEEYGVGFAKDNTKLRDAVNAALHDMAKDGTLAQISTKWFSKDLTTIGK